MRCVCGGDAVELFDTSTQNFSTSSLLRLSIRRALCACVCVCVSALAYLSHLDGSFFSECLACKMKSVYSMLHHRTRHRHRKPSMAMCRCLQCVSCSIFACDVHTMTTSLAATATIVVVVFPFSSALCFSFGCAFAIATGAVCSRPPMFMDGQRATEPV